MVEIMHQIAKLLFQTPTPFTGICNYQRKDVKLLPFIHKHNTSPAASLIVSKNQVNDAPSQRSMPLQGIICEYLNLFSWSMLQNNNATWNNKSGFSPRATEVLRDLRNDGALCDCIIKSSDGVEFLVHRAILSACCPFFLNQLSDPNAVTSRKKGDTVCQLQLNDINEGALRIFIEFAYTATLPENIEINDACNAYKLAFSYSISNLVEEMTKYLQTNLAITNCVDVYIMTLRSNPEGNLRRFVQWFILQRLEVLANETFQKLLCLSEEELLTLLDDDWLNVSNERKVFEIITGWIDKATEKEQKLVPVRDARRCQGKDSRLWQALRYGLLPAEYFLNQVLANPHLPEILASEGTTFFNQFIPNLNGCRSIKCNTQIRLVEKVNRPRFPPSYLLVFGGWSSGACTSKIEVYDRRVDKWRRIGNIENGPRAYQRTVLMNGLVYLLGGFDGQEHYSGCHTFSPISGEWRMVAPMNFRRCYVSANVLNDKLCAIGGCDKTERLSSAEIYDASSNQWSLLPKMSTKRSDAGCAVAKINGDSHVIVCGGFDGLSCLSSVEMLSFDQATSEYKWSQLPPMTTRRSGLSCCTLNDQVYALGGFDGISRLNSVERFSVARQDWQPVASMVIARSNFTATVLNEKIYVCGGFDGQSTISDCESYDPKTNTWERVCSMNDDRSALSCVVLNFGNDDDLVKKTKKEDLENFVYPRDNLKVNVETNFTNN